MFRLMGAAALLVGVAEFEGKRAAVVVRRMGTRSCILAAGDSDELKNSVGVSFP